ncbi:MAG: hypothetical protein NXH86_05390 [Flavobacteriaceae bacterium]|nr:hypothetical protein [Flavobacteriaceae bacterium]
MSKKRDKSEGQALGIHKTPAFIDERTRGECCLASKIVDVGQQLEEKG